MYANLRVQSRVCNYRVMAKEEEVALAKAAAKYRRAVKRAEEIQKHAADDLADAMRTAYAGGQGMKKADILRATGHVWSRTWMDQALKNEPTQPSE